MPIRPHPRLVRLVLFTQGPALAVWVALLAVQYEGERREAAAQLNLQSQSLALAVAERLHGVERQLNMLGSTLDVEAPDLDAFARQARLVDSLARVDGIMLATPAGAALFDTRGGGTTGPQAVLPAASEVPFGTRLLPTLTLGDASRVTIVTVPVLRDGGMRYLLLARLQVSRFQALLAERRAPAGSTAVILDAGGTVVASRPEGAPSPFTSAAKPLLTAVTHAPATDWRVAVSLPAQQWTTLLWGALHELLPFTLLQAFLLWFAVRLHRRSVPASRWAASEQRADVILESVDDAVLIGDRHLCIERLNSAAARIFGVDRYALLGQPVTRLIAPETLDELLHHAGTERSDGRPQVVSGWGHRGDGTLFPLECSLTRLTGADGLAFCTFTARDTTGQAEGLSAAAAGARLLQRMNLAFQHELHRETELQQQAIARELHDAVGSSLAGIGLLLASARNLTPGTKADGLIAMCQEQVTRTMQQIRRISHGMVPAGQERGALEAALEQFANETSATGVVTCTVRVRGDFSEVPAITGAHLFRIVQEATGNALNHGGARHVRIRLLQKGLCRRLTVRDDGAGCDPALLARTSNGLGIRSMRMRAHAIGGRLEVRAWPGRGLGVRVTWTAAPVAALAA